MILSSRRTFLAVGLVVAFTVAVLAAKVRDRDDGIVVKSSVENFRDAPNGKRLGTLLENVEIEKISQEGKWVRFRVEGWIWGPSLEGFEIETAIDEADDAPPAMPLQDNLPRIKRFVNDRHGLFYGVSLDEDLGRLAVRFRVRDLEREALERRQMAVQAGVLDILDNKIEFSTIRIETNRPDGSGEVGAEIAETAVSHVRQLANGTVEGWKEQTRTSSDGGETWNE
jgi:hypothetical protein